MSFSLHHKSWVVEESMTPPTSSPASSDGFPSSTASRGYDENHNFHFQTKAWPTTSSAGSPTRKFVVGNNGNNNNNNTNSPGRPLSIQTNPQTTTAATSQHPWKPSTADAVPAVAPMSSPLPPRSASGVSKQPHPQLQLQQPFPSSPGRLPKSSVRESASAANTAGSKDPRQALVPRNNGSLERPPQQPVMQTSASAAAMESLEAVRRESDAWQQQLLNPPRTAASVSSNGGRKSANSTPLRSRDAAGTAPPSSDSHSMASAGVMDPWRTDNTAAEPDDLEQALFEQRLTEDLYGVAVRKINHNGKSNLRYVKCFFVDAAELEVDANGFSSSRSVSSHSRGTSRFSRFRGDRSVERSEGLMRGKKVKVLSWGKKKEVNLPLERFVCVRKGKTTDRTRRNASPACRILSLITDDPYCPSLDIEAPTRLDRDKFAKAFSRFLRVPLEGDDVRSIRSDMTPPSLKGKPFS